jgi:hypothetical protein
LGEDAHEYVLDRQATTYQRNFQTGHKADFDCDLFIDEVKNLSLYSKGGKRTYISYKWFVTDILPRFEASDPMHQKRWRLFISTFYHTDQRIDNLVKMFDLQIIELGVQVLDEYTSTIVIGRTFQALYSKDNVIVEKCVGEECSEVDVIYDSSYYHYNVYVNLDSMIDSFVNS